MPRKTLCYGFKIAFKTETGSNQSYVTATNNVLLPLGVPDDASGNAKFQFENAIFQIVTGDGDAGVDLTTRKIGEELKFGQIIRLIHVNTNMLVCENRKVRATKEKVNQKVILAAVTSEEARTSRWRVMPRYKVRSEGEKVCDRDRIILKSVVADSFLHVAPISDSTSDHFFEVNCSMQPSGLTLQAYDTEEFNPDARELRGGDCVKLYHKEERSFLVSDKGDSCIFDPPELRGGGLVTVDIENSNSMFVLEFESVVAGGLVTFGRKRRYHLKSLSTGKYLCARFKMKETGAPEPRQDIFETTDAFEAPTAGLGLDQEPDPEQHQDDVDHSIEVCLTDMSTGPETKICFHQATDDSSDVVKKNSRVFIEFPLVKEGVWFSCGGPVKVSSRGRVSSKSENNPRVQENTRPEKHVVVTATANHKDGTELIKVSAQEFQDLNAVLALVPPFDRLISQMKARTIPSTQLVSQVRENIMTLGRLCTKSGEEDILRREGTPLVGAQNRLVDQDVPSRCLALVEAILGPKGLGIDHDKITSFALVETEIASAAGTPKEEALATSMQAVQAVGPTVNALKYSDFLQLIRLCFRLIMLSCYQNPRNRSLLSDSIDAIIPYIEFPYGALYTLKEICTDNAKVIDTPDDHTFSDIFVDLALKNSQKNPKFLEFLCLLCTCNKIGLRKAQDSIAGLLFQQARSNSTTEPPVFMKLVLSSETGEVMVQYAPSGVSFSPKGQSRAGPRGISPALASEDDFLEIPFAEFCNSDQDLGGTIGGSSIGRQSMEGSMKSGVVGGNRSLSYFSTQLELFVRLCVGRHDINVIACKNFIPHGAVLPLIKNENTPPTLRSLFLQYWHATVLDVPPYDDRIDACRNIVYIWETDSMENSMEIGSQGVEADLQSQEQISEMKAFLHQFLVENSSMDPSDIAFNRCVLSAVRVCSHLTRFGLLVGPNESYVPWMEALIPVLDGRDDKVPQVDVKYSRRFKSATFQRYKFDEDNQMMMEVKIAVVEIIEMMLTFVRARKVRELITVFRKNEEIPHICAFINESSKVHSQSKDLKEKRIDAKNQEGANILMAGLGKIKSVAGAGLGAVKKVGGAIASLGSKAEPDPLNYVCVLLDVLIDNMRYEHEPVVACATTLFLQVMNAQQALLSPLASVQILGSEQGVNYYREVKPQLVDLTKMTQFAIARQELHMVQRLIETMGNSLLRSQTDFVINPERQGILKNMGVHLTVSSIICRFADVQTHMTEVLAEGYRFLTLMLTDNQEIALDLFPFVDKYIRHLGYNIGAVQLLTRMFEGNFDLVSSVSDTTLTEIVYALPKSNKDPSIAHLLHLFVHQSAANVGTIMRNHQTVWKNLLECDEATPGIVRCHDVWTGSQGKKYRKALLQQQEYLEPKSQIVYHLEIMSIITHCATGRDQQRRHDIRSALFAGSVGITDVIDVLVRKEIPEFFRVVYMRFFNEVFLNDKSLRVLLLDSNKKQSVLPRLLAMLQDDLMRLDSQLNKLNQGDKLADQVTEISGAADSLSSSQKMPAALGEMTPLGKKFLSTEVFLHYTFEGVIPLLTVLLQDVFTDQFGKDEDTRGLETVNEYQDQLRDLAELVLTDLTLIVANHPQQPQPVSEPSRHAAGNADEPIKHNPLSYNPLLSKVPLRYRSGVDLFFSELNEYVDHGAERALAVLPFVPLESLKRMKVSLQLFVDYEYRDGDPEVQALLDSVDRYILPKTSNVSDTVGPSEGIWGHFMAWKDFRKKFEESNEQTSHEHRYEEAARVLLKKGNEGTQALKNIVRVVDRDCFADTDRVGVLNLLRQVIICEKLDYTDMSLLIPSTDEDDENDKQNDVAYRLLLETLTLNKSQEKRQDIIASWPRASSLPPKIIMMLSSSNKELLQATLELGCDLLREGNNKVQTSIYNFMGSTTDEDFFLDCREKLMICRDEVRHRRRAIKNEVPEAEKNKGPLPDDLHQRLDRRFNFSVTAQLLELTQLLCEGHYGDMQNYLREQRDNQISINVLEPMISLLEVLARSVDRGTLDFIIQTLNTITETMQGPCLRNQEFVVSQNIGDIATYILGSDYGDCSQEGNWQVRMATMTLLLSLFEGHMNTQLIQVLISSVSLDAMGTLMDTTYKEWAEERGISDSKNALDHGLDAGKDFFKGLFIGLGGEDEFKDTLNLSCSIFVFLKATLDLQSLNLGSDEESDQFTDKHGATVRDAFRASNSYRKLSEKMATIEIMRLGTVEKVYFRVVERSKANLRDEAKDDLMREVNRTGDMARLTDFLGRCFNLIHEIEYYEDMQKTPGLALIYKYAWYFDTGSLLIALVMNIFLLFTVDYKNISHTVNVEDGHEAKAYMAFGIILIIGQVGVFLNFFFGPVRIRLNACWMDWQDARNQEAIKESKKGLSIEPPHLEPGAEARLSFPVHFAYDLFFLATWTPFYLRALFICTSFLGYYISPVFYSVQMLQIVEKSEQLQNVVLSVTRNGRNLALTGCLLLVILYIFAIVAYYSYSEYFIWQMSGHGANCDTLLRCTIVLIVYGLKAGGGVGDTLAPPLFRGIDGDMEAYLRMLYDFLFFTFLIIMCLNIVFGIILDTFGELRQERDAVEDDQHKKCFICGLSRSEFDRVATSGFEQHFTSEHHMWDYLYFMHYVQLKDADEHTGQEGFVKECMDNMVPKFFPRGRAMVLDSTPAAADTMGEDGAEGGEEEAKKKGGHHKSPQDGGGEGDDGGGDDAFASQRGAPRLSRGAGDPSTNQQVYRLEEMVRQMAADQQSQRQHHTQQVDRLEALVRQLIAEEKRPTGQSTSQK